VRYWNGNEAIGRYMRARAAAAQEMWIVLEHVPHEVGPWLMANQHEVDGVLAQLFEAIGALHDRGITHFDSHLGNAVTDGSNVRLTDFGLAMAASFDLSPDELDMLDRHRHYDYGVLLGSLGLATALALGGYMPSGDLADRIDELGADGGPFDPAFAAALHRYREPITYMVEFFDRMRSPAKRSTYDDATFAARLEAAGVPVR
jgi:serine/threonine protein kinase